ncbi:MAG: hypothetical protein WCE79_06835 [Xanthobacteraceae bacterium]
MHQLSEFSNLDEFLFETPIYGRLKRPKAEQLSGMNLQMVQGWCPFCKKPSTFRCLGDLVLVEQWAQAPKGSFHTIVLRCVWNDKHHPRFDILFTSDEVQKIGQYPSFATMAQGRDKEVRKLLNDEDATEFFKAVGLASHDTGIGAFVYIRRIFERVIRKCFDEHKQAEGWTEEQFMVRMDQRIELMKHHLPDFLVENSRLYGILSKGIHELTEAECIAFFPIIREAILMILSEEKEKRDRRTRKTALQNAIAQHKIGA